VAPDAKVWFQNFEDHDGMGNSVVHKYLMTTGYLWTGQFPESSLPVEEGRPQSMELQNESVQGHWETNYDNGMDFFIINDAIIQKICILGDDVEPCFEGASVTAPDVSTKFTLDDNFKHTLYSMMQDLKNALNGGGQQMDNLENTVSVEEETVTPVSDFTQVDEVTSETVSEVNENIEDTSAPADYVKEDEKKEEEESDDSNESESESEEDKGDDEDDDKEKAKKYELLEEELNNLKNSYSALQSQYQELVNFKREIDNQKKDALIAEFYMLSDDDKADVIQNKEKYTLEEIKAKLSVTCFDKKVSFSKENADNKEEEIVTYTINDNENNSLPDWVKAVKEQEKLG
jgi:hypothetical protein